MKQTKNNSLKLISVQNLIHWGKTKIKQKSESLNNKGNKERKHKYASMKLQCWNYQRQGRN